MALSHVKTHKTREGCLIQAGWGGDGGTESAASAEVVGFVASTLPELSMVADLARRHRRRPFGDVLYGIPICQSKLSAVHELAMELAAATDHEGTVHLLVDHPDQVSFLEEYARRHPSAGKRWSVFLKLDTGYHRAGTTCDGHGEYLAMKIVNSPHLTLKGLYSHW